MIPAHDSPLAALAFDASGTKLATASEKVKRLHQAEGKGGFSVCCWAVALIRMRVSVASSQGTVIRVFSIPEGQKLFEFRRGVKR